MSKQSDSKKRSFISIETLKSIWSDSQKSLAIVAALALVSSVVVVIMLWTATERYRPLYSSTSNYDSSQILELLDQSGIAYQLGRADGNILVPEDKVYEIRKILAARGLKEQIPVGMESLEGLNSLGQSQFLEEARYRHALEGELSKSIVTLENVSYARVHLAVVKETLFNRSQKEKSSSASVVVNLVDGHDIKSDQIEAIINMVSGAVVGLKPEQVQIVDQFGRLLSDEASVGDYTLSTAKQTDFQSRVEDRLVRQASDILTPILGPSNFRVQVVATIDFSRVEETQEAYSDPIVRSETKRTDSNRSNVALGVPGALSNTPPVTDGEQSSSNERAIEKSEITSNYALTGKVTHTVHQQGEISRLSVSVVLNELDGEIANIENAELRVRSLIEAAVGLDDERGDKLVVNTLPFRPVADLTPPEVPWFEQYQVVEIVKIISVTILGLVLVFKALIPLIHSIVKNLSMARQNDEQEAEASLKPNSSSPARPSHMPNPDSPIEEQILHVQKIADGNTERTAEVFRSWMNK
ncbi:flagellar basal-body MS-ring/collar protein FliF [Vibrio sp. PNB22_3_1]